MKSENTQPLNDIVNIDRLITNRKSMGHFRLQTEHIQNTHRPLSASQVDELTSQSAVGSFYGLPSRVNDILRERRGISCLYDWQKEVLSLESVRKGGNIILSLPTSGGKTLIAELFCLKHVLCHRKNVLIVLPFVAIVKEKVDSLTEFSVELDFRVEEYAGGRGAIPPAQRKHQSVYICTIEKANSLFDSLLESGRREELGLVIIDELHMIGGGGARGALLEGLMTKMLFCSGLQIIGMSSTLARINDLKTFMSAEYYSNSFRPVVLSQFVKLNSNIYTLSQDQVFELSRTVNYPYTRHMSEIDCDHLAGLVSEVVPQKSCLIFCPTRKNCESISLMLCKLMPKNFKRLKIGGKTKLLSDLDNESAGNLCSILRQTIVYGVAYHHGGLTNEDRKLLEDAFSARIILVMCCTSTLAAGVNLPAQRVIIRSPFVGMEPLSPAQYKQMCGRAGRAGLDDVGESYLIIQEEHKAMAMSLVAGSCSDDDLCCCSCLLTDGRFICNLILSIVGFGLVTSPTHLILFAERTLAYHQFGDEVHKLFNESLTHLIDSNLINSEQGNLKVTALGRAACKGSVDIRHCNGLYGDLEFGLSGGLVLTTQFHLLTLVTPYDLAAQIKPDFRIMLKQVEKLNKGELIVMNRMGISEDYIILSAGNSKVKEKVDQIPLSRFYLSLMLNSLCNRKTIVEVADIFQVNRGYVQNLVNSAGSFASNLIHFVQELDEFWAYQVILPPFVSRLSYSMHTELVPLLSLPYVSQIRAQQLYKAGFKTLKIIAYSNANELTTRVPNVSVGVAWRIIKAAMQCISDQAEQLMEEAKQIISKPYEC